MSKNNTIIDSENLCEGFYSALGRDFSIWANYFYMPYVLSLNLYLDYL